MAAQTPVVIRVLPPKPVELLSKITDKHIIEKYVAREHVEFSIPSMDVAVIDFQLLMNSEEEFSKFENLLNSWGCFQLVNHGITSAKLAEVRQVWKDFCKLPVEEKEKYKRELGKMEGWGGDQMAEGHPFNWNDRLILNIYPLERRNPKFWPDQILPKFREIIDEYANELSRIKCVLFDAICKLLKLPNDNLLAKYGKEGITVSRFNYYPPCPNPNQIMGLKAHSDVNFFTMLLQDNEVEGLHIQKDEKWFKVPVLRDALVVNVADIMELMSNGRLKAVFHRAVTNDTKERTSIAFAYGPPPNTELEPLKELIDEEWPRLYPKIKNYLSITSDYYSRGQKGLPQIALTNSKVENELIQNLESKVLL